MDPLHPVSAPCMTVACSSDNSFSRGDVLPALPYTQLIRSQALGKSTRQKDPFDLKRDGEKQVTIWPSQTNSFVLSSGLSIYLLHVIKLTSSCLFRLSFEAGGFRNVDVEK